MTQTLCDRCLKVIQPGTAKFQLHTHCLTRGTPGGYRLQVELCEYCLNYIEGIIKERPPELANK